MRMLPGIFGDGFFDDFMSGPLERHFLVPNHHARKNVPEVMKTDIREKDGNYEIAMDLPGIKKENVKIELDDGYLCVSATNVSSNEEKDSNQSYIKRERYCGHYKRNFFVGESVSNEDIKAKFEDGVLLITFPKKDYQDIKAKKFIEIE